MKDKNNKEIKAGHICKTHDRFGDVWIAPIHRVKTDLVFDSNYQTTLHDYWSKELEIIGNEKETKWRSICNQKEWKKNQERWKRKIKYRDKKI